MADKDIGRFQIPMHDSLFVHVHKGTRSLFHIAPNGWLIEGNLIFLMISDEFFQIPFISPLSYDDEFIVVDKGVDVLNDVGMV